MLSSEIERSCLSPGADTISVRKCQGALRKWRLSGCIHLNTQRALQAPALHQVYQTCIARTGRPNWCSSASCPQGCSHPSLTVQISSEHICWIVVGRMEGHLENCVWSSYSRGPGLGHYRLCPNGFRSVDCSAMVLLLVQSTLSFPPGSHERCPTRFNSSNKLYATNKGGERQASEADVSAASRAALSLALDISP